MTTPIPPRPEIPHTDPMETLANIRHEFGEHGGVNMSIEASSTFTVLNAATLEQMFHGERGPDQGCYLYGRHFNPTVYALARQIAALESTEAAYCTSSGMGAIACTTLQICRKDDHAVVAGTVYGGTHALFQNLLPAVTGMRTTFVDPRDLEAVEAAVADGAKLLFVEAMANPTLAVSDLPRLAEIAHRHGATFVVDNTFSPLIISPARHGADVVIHSLTKFIGGASDIIAGVICSSREFITSLMDVEMGALMLLGPTLDPHTAFQLSTRIPHLPLRVKEHSARALAFAQRLERLGYDVVYPGLPSHPDHTTLRTLANEGYGYGGLIGLDLGEVGTAQRLMQLLQDERFGFIAVSLGYSETLMSVSAVSTSSELSEEEQAKVGISPGYLRLSIGYTGTLEQRWAQFERALSLLGPVPRKTGRTRGCSLIEVDA